MCTQGSCCGQIVIRTFTDLFNAAVAGVKCHAHDWNEVKMEISDVFL